MSLLFYIVNLESGALSSSSSSSMVSFSSSVPTPLLFQQSFQAANHLSSIGYSLCSTDFKNIFKSDKKVNVKNEENKKDKESYKPEYSKEKEDNPLLFFCITLDDENKALMNNKEEFKNIYCLTCPDIPESALLRLPADPHYRELLMKFNEV